MLDGGLHVLVVDDDREIRELTGRFLRKHGYRVTAVQSGREMRETLANSDVDLIILDLMLPGEDGLTLCREIRANSQTPIIMVTALGEEEDRIVGLEMGADDYLSKPFNPRELLARLRAVLRRAQTGAPISVRRSELISFADWTLNLVRRELTTPDGVVVDLSGGEYDMLLALVEHPQRVLSRDQLIDLARGRSASPYERSIDVQISRLRRKLQRRPTDSDMIKTVRGVGYIFMPSVERK